MATDDNGERIRDMAKFLNTSATNYFLDELIQTAKDRLIQQQELYTRLFRGA